MSSNGKKESFWSALVEALVIRPKNPYRNEPAVYEDTFGGDLANALTLRPVYRKPVDKPDQGTS